MNVLDASALLAFLKNEPGATTVQETLEEGACCSAVNWSETAQKIRTAGGSWTLAAAGLEAFGLRIEAATREDAELAAAYWQAVSNLSLGDRFCHALAERLGATAWTADRAWLNLDRVRLIR